jgi:methyl coenzyme M reductase alpha subunit
MAKNAKIEREQKKFIKSMRKKFSENPDQPAYTVCNGVAPNRKIDEHVTLIPHTKPRRSRR